MDLITPEQKERLGNAQVAIRGWLQALSQNQKIGMLIVFLVLISGGYWYLFFSPVQTQIGILQEEIAGLDQKIRVDEAKVRRLDELKKAYKEIEADLARLQDELPPEEEAALLLKQISEMSRPEGLELNSWAPGGRTESDNGLYVALPVNVSMAGGYHAIATFFDQIRNLKRVVSVSGVDLGSATVVKRSQGTVQMGGVAANSVAEPQVKIQVKFTLLAYAAPRGNRREDGVPDQ
tara:strand:- start:3547 stop:4251 length:705 start_codon:yes stop_codon:yes gene_type:complete